MVGCGGEARMLNKITLSFLGGTCGLIFLISKLSTTKIFVMVLNHQTSFLANLRVLNLKMTLLFCLATVFAVQKYFIYEKKYFLDLFSIYMILTNGNISQRKIIETFNFIFKPTNIDLLIEKYYFCNNNLTLSF